MLLIGQSLELHRDPLASALRARDAAPLVANVEAQLAAGADAVDVNIGAEGRADEAADDLAWAVSVLRPLVGDRPLFLDTGAPAVIAAALARCERGGRDHGDTEGRLVANAVPAGATVGAPGGAGDDAPDEDADALLRGVADAGGGLVVSPRRVDERDGPAKARVIVEAAQAMARRARAIGCTGPIFLDALAYPGLLDPVRCRRSLETLRLMRAMPDVERLVAVGNVGALAPFGASLRVVYAAAAVGAGATALILPVEEPAVVRAVRIATHEARPTTEDEYWLLQLAEATAEHDTIPKPPLKHLEAARAIFIPTS